MSKLVDILRDQQERGRGYILRPGEAAELLAHIERLEANQIPEGCVAVPREPTEATEAMMITGQEAVLQAPDDLEGAAHYIYTLMIAAAEADKGA